MSPRRPGAGGRLQRVLALVPYIAAHPGVTIAELATRFQVPEAELEHDLELLPFCGLPPYSPDRLIDVEIYDGQVWIRFAEYFERPLRLSAGEGLALVAACHALLAVPGSERDGPLASAATKLEAAVGSGAGVSVDVTGGPFLEALRDAAHEHRRVEVDYYSFGRDALTTRRIDPWSVFHAFGQWYVAAYCHAAGEERLFRVDRVRALRPTDERFEPPPGADVAERRDVYHPRPDDPRVELTLAASAEWVVDTYPTERADRRADGTFHVVLTVSEQAWLERLLLRLGPDATVLGPPELVGTAEATASRLLGRYETDGPVETRDDAAARRVPDGSACEDGPDPR
ncbi:MAG: WYL domain-containing protein [Acidimicrobiia bacterium]